MSKELKKLSKEQQRGIHSLFIESVSVPMLILATTVLFTAVSTFGVVDSAWEVYTFVLCAIAIPVLGISIFSRKAVAIVSSKMKELPSSVEWCSAFGFSFSFMSFCSYLTTIFWWLGLVALLSGVVAFLMHFSYLKNARSIKK